MTGQSFADKTVLITGGASGIGLATAREFARAGANVVVADMDAGGITAVSKEFQASRWKILGLHCDISDQDACGQAVTAACRAFGGIDVLFNNAGITQRSLFENTQVSVVRRVMEVNFFGAVHMTKAALPSLLERKGTIVVNESIAGVAPLLGRCGYAASKHALHGFFTSLRCELAAKKVHVMIICPGFIQTNLQTRALGGDGRVTTRPQTRLGKQQTPEFVAARIRRGVEQKQSMMVFTLVGRIGYLISRWSPPLYERLMTWQFKSELG
jgi:NAD(P)-dependent dehydrogenase (short-subunit alcohol dehydrogenase family)